MVNKHKTVKQLSDELGVSKPAITKYMMKTFRSKYTKMQGNRLLIDTTGTRNIKEHFKESVHTKTNINRKSNDNLSINDNQNDVTKAKDEQLKQRAEEISSMHKLMDQNQQLLLNTQKENKRLVALQLPPDSSQDVQDGDFKEKTGSLPLKKSP